MFERRAHPLLPRRAFYARLVRHFCFGLGLVVVALGIGVVGYRFFEGLAWVDAFASAAMILSDMGPTEPLRTTGGKIFAGCYALFSGLMFIVVVGIVLGPVAHRFLHKFHLNEDGPNSRDGKK